MSSGEEE